MGAEMLSGNNRCYNVLQIPVYIGYRGVTNENNWIIPWIFAIFFVYLLCNMIDMINKWVTNNKIWLKALGDFTFLAFVFWLFYWALWIFCPC